MYARTSGLPHFDCCENLISREVYSLPVSGVAILLRSSIKKYQWYQIVNWFSDRQSQIFTGADGGLWWIWTRLYISFLKIISAPSNRGSTLQMDLCRVAIQGHTQGSLPPLDVSGSLNSARVHFQEKSHKKRKKKQMSHPYTIGVRHVASLTPFPYTSQGIKKRL